MKTWRIFAQFLIIVFIIFLDAAEGSKNKNSDKKPVDSEQTISDVQPHVQLPNDKHVVPASAPTNFVDSDHFLILVCSICVVIVLAIIVAICFKIIKEYKLSLERVHNATVYRGNIPFWKPTWWFASYLFCRTCCTCALCRGQVAMLGVMGELAEATGDPCQAKHGFTEPLLSSTYKRSFDSDQPDYKSCKQFKRDQVFDTSRPGDSKKYLHSSIDESASSLGRDVNYLEDCAITKQVYEIPDLNGGRDHVKQTVPIQTAPHPSQYSPASNGMSNYSVQDGGPLPRKLKTLTTHTSNDTRCSRNCHYRNNGNLQPIKEESFTQNRAENKQPPVNPRSVYWTGKTPENIHDIEETDSDHFYDRITSSEHIYDSISSTNEHESFTKSSKPNKISELGVDSAHQSEHTSIFARLRRGKSTKAKTGVPDKRLAAKPVNQGEARKTSKRQASAKSVQYQCATVPSSFKEYVQILDENKDMIKADNPLQSTDSCPRHHAPSIPGSTDTTKMKSNIVHNQVDARNTITPSKTVRFGPNSQSPRVEAVQPVKIHEERVAKHSARRSFITSQEKDYKAVNDIYSSMRQQIDKRAASSASTQAQGSSFNKQKPMPPLSAKSHRISSAAVHGALNRLSRDAKASQTGNGQGIFALHKSHTRNNNATDQNRRIRSKVIKNKALQIQHCAYILPHLARPPSQVSADSEGKKSGTHGNRVRPIDETTLSGNKDECVMGYEPRMPLISQIETKDCLGQRQKQVDSVQEEPWSEHNYFTSSRTKAFGGPSNVDTTSTVSPGVSVVLNSSSGRAAYTPLVPPVAPVSRDNVQLGHLIDLDHSNNADKPCVECQAMPGYFNETNEGMLRSLPHLSTCCNKIRFANIVPSLDGTRDIVATIGGRCAESDDFKLHNGVNNIDDVANIEDKQGKDDTVQDNQVSPADGSQRDSMPRYDLTFHTRTDGEEKPKVVLPSMEDSNCPNNQTELSPIVHHHEPKLHSEAATTERYCLDDHYANSFNEVNTEQTVPRAGFFERIQITEPYKYENRMQPMMPSEQADCSLTLNHRGVQGDREPLLDYVEYGRHRGDYNLQDAGHTGQHMLIVERMAGVHDDITSVHGGTCITETTRGLYGDNGIPFDTKCVDKINISYSLGTIEEESIPVFTDDCLNDGPTEVTENNIENEQTVFCMHADLRSPRSCISVDLDSDNNDPEIKSISISNLVEAYCDIMPIKPVSVNNAFSGSIARNAWDMNSVYSHNGGAHRNESKTSTHAIYGYGDMAPCPPSIDCIQTSQGATIATHSYTSNIKTDSDAGVTEFCNQISAILSPDNAKVEKTVMDINHSGNCKHVPCTSDCTSRHQDDIFLPITELGTENRTDDHCNNQVIEDSMLIYPCSDWYNNSDELSLSLANSSSDSCSPTPDIKTSAGYCYFRHSMPTTGVDSCKTRTYSQLSRMNCDEVLSLKGNNITTLDTHVRCNPCINDRGLINDERCVGCSECRGFTDGHGKHIDHSVISDDESRLDITSPDSTCRPTSSEDILNLEHR